MSYRIRLACSVVFGLFLTFPVLAADEKADIAGHYTVSGMNPGGGNYTGKAEIRKNGNSYEISWLIGQRESHSGVGILDGDHFAVAYQSANIAGVVMYKREKDSLVGRWAILGKNGVYTETLTRTEAPKGGNGQVAADPGSVGLYRQNVGQSYYFEVTGTNNGVVWGSGTYTDDSQLSTSAVHAGLVKVGEKAVIKVTMVAGQGSYEGSERNGVTTMSYGPWGGSYRIQADDRAKK